MSTAKLTIARLESLLLIEEAVVNAVYHRSYEEREPIEVRISRDELVVLSFPGPDRSIRLADFEAGIRNTNEGLKAIERVKCQNDLLLKNPLAIDFLIKEVFNTPRGN